MLAIPELLRGAVHLWTLDLGTAGSSLPLTDEAVAATAVLSAAEWERARRFRFPWLTRRYVLAHAGLRVLLGQYTGMGAAELRFVAGTYGKPELDGGAGVAFNLSGSGELAVVAVTRLGAVGVDVEQVRPLSGWQGMAERVLTEGERRVLQAAPEGEKLGCFFQFWTRKEACLKAVGCGFAVEPTAVECVGGSIRWAEGARAGSGGVWEMHEFVPRDGYVGAAVVAQRYGLAAGPQFRIFPRVEAVSLFG